jgi:hypothetical protein
LLAGAVDPAEREVSAGRRVDDGPPVLIGWDGHVREQRDQRAAAVEVAQ